jgi:hypothetical protein
MVASGRRQARYSAGETSTGPGASPVVPTGYYVSGRTRFPHDRARKQAARQRAEPVLRKPESTGTKVRAKLARLRAGKRHHRESCPVLSSTTVRIGPAMMRATFSAD